MEKKSILDFSNERILVIDNPKAVIEKLNLILNNFHFERRDIPYLSKQLSKKIRNYSVSTADNKTVAGAFGAFLSLFGGGLITRMMNMDITSGLVISSLCAIGAFLYWLFMMAYDENIVALTPKWTITLHYLSLVTFSSLLIFPPIYMLGPFDIQEIFAPLITVTTLHIILVLLKSLFDVYYEKILSKKSVWFVMVTFLVMILYSEFIFTGNL